jgi:hypothetical protein
MSTAKVLQFPAADTLWNEADHLTEELHDLFQEIKLPCPEVEGGIAYEWTRESCAEVRRAMGLLREALDILEEVRDCEGERFDAHNDRLESLGIVP